MVNQQILQGRWNEIKGRIRSHWGQLTDEDLPQFHGEVDKLIGVIQRKTGEGREAIESYLNEVSGAAASAFGQAAENVRRFSNQTAESVQRTAQQASEQLRVGVDGAERFVRERPRESLAICFGVGLVVGVLVSVLLSSNK